ncbi:type II toxin-antitoxin system PemK/MazF family toxin (plasmid) [Cyanobacterium sp. IPPAS B-1200]|uniref:type II toxin-antitoxin system PemK/MazF family toxin n=1 Tax=Cyanobacterium sp. IPPAS B-1200 TaxID=1562720 RepID=UPI00085269E4|nr:type II toxin-antitoxin system PemK/MazF family toxin [Cyanobacterium sp. IPPAS B-1200]OEJ78542.1 mRNA-degrading endonuclease [Cyanobacterium sp. IPPAS B-1200]
MVKIDNRIPQRGDIVKLELNPRTGSEQSGYRPALVISPIAYNQISKIILICPITSRKKGWVFEVKLPSEMQTHGVVLVDQIRAVDCVARQTTFVEESPPSLIDEVLAKLETLIG